MDSSEIINQIRMVFNQMDTDKSGTLSYDEVKTGLKMIDFGLGEQNESLADNLFQDLSKESETITVDNFIEWNLSKIPSLLVKGEESTLAAMFISPAFQIIDRLTTLKSVVPEANISDLDFCIDLIRSGKIYAAGTEIVSSNVKKDTLNVMMFFSEALKRKELKDDENSTMQIAQQRTIEQMDSLISEIQDLAEVVQVETLNFNIFQTYEQVRSVTRLTHAICDKGMKDWDLYRNLGINFSTFMLFCYNISAGYPDENPYHNNFHAADVVQFIVYALKNSEVIAKADLKPLHMMVIIVAALIHDFKHPGVTNSYLANTKDEIAWRYNDRSLLENYHASEAFAVTRKSECNIFENLQPAEFRTARHIIIECVLSTDMAKHNSTLSLLQNQILTERDMAEDKTLCLSLLMHASDISHPARPWKLHERWTQMVQEEFFMQGDKEKEMGMSVIPMFDRTQSSTIPAMQTGFINGVILPYFKPLVKLLKMKDDIINNIELNRDKWAEFIK